MKDWEMLALAAGGLYVLGQTGIGTGLGTGIGAGIGQTATGVPAGLIQGFYQSIWSLQDWFYQSVMGSPNPWSGLHG